jgi:hypothetical protein
MLSWVFIEIIILGNPTLPDLAYYYKVLNLIYVYLKLQLLYCAMGNLHINFDKGKKFNNFAIIVLYLGKGFFK